MSNQSAPYSASIPLREAAGISPARWPRRVFFFIVITTAAAWASWPVTDVGFTVSPSVSTSSPVRAPAPAAAPLDIAAFHTPLWVAPPNSPPPPPVSAAPPPLPLRLQLLAVVHEHDRYSALLYDPDADKIVVVAEGEHVAGRTVDRVTATDVQLRDSSGLVTLLLKRDTGGVSVAGGSGGGGS